MRIFWELFLERATGKRRINYVNVKTFLIPSVPSTFSLERPRRPVYSHPPLFASTTNFAESEKAKTFWIARFLSQKTVQIKHVNRFNFQIGDKFA